MTKVKSEVLLLSMLPDYLPKPHIAANDDGETGLSWLRQDDRFEMMISPDRRWLDWCTHIGGKWIDGAGFYADSQHIRRTIERLEEFYDI